jgi:PKHD-type hydroxylase
MMAKIPILSEEECDRITASLNTMSWQPGVSPSKEYSEKVKGNLELPMGIHKDADVHHKFIIDRLMKTKFFIRRSLPKNIGRPRFNLYKDGGYYGKHADSAFMGSNPEIRTDLSMTLFLSDPDDYVGGELRLEFTSGAVMELREPKGTVVVYPSGVMHEVLPVTEGERIGFVAWVESHISDPYKRDILAEITMLCEDMSERENLSDLHVRMLNIKHNMFRQWMKKE